MPDKSSDKYLLTLKSLYNSLLLSASTILNISPLNILFSFFKIASIITFVFPISRTDSIAKMPFLLRLFYKFFSLSMNYCSKKIESDHILPQIKSIH